MTILNAFTVILVEAQNPINLGNVMRAMKNMGLSQLSLVRPGVMDLSKTQISAHRTEDMLATMRVFDSLDEALSEVHESFGFSARTRTRTWSSLEMEEASDRAVSLAQHQRQVALVFGREQTGLSNEELACCTHRVHIATSPYSSLNLSQAVLLASHAIFRRLEALEDLEAAKTLPSNEVASLGKIDNFAPGSVPATLIEQRRLLKRCAEMLCDIGYFKSDSKNSAIHRLQNIIHRAELRDDEIRLLLGICSEVSNYAQLLARGIEPSRCRPDFSLPQCD